RRCGLNPLVGACHTLATITYSQAALFLLTRLSLQAVDHSGCDDVVEQRLAPPGPAGTRPSSGWFELASHRNYWAGLYVRTPRGPGCTRRRAADPAAPHTVRRTPANTNGRGCPLLRIAPGRGRPYG